jgi:hypothetical protein
MWKGIERSNSSDEKSGDCSALQPLREAQNHSRVRVQTGAIVAQTRNADIVLLCPLDGLFELRPERSQMVDCSDL